MHLKKNTKKTLTNMNRVLKMGKFFIRNLQHIMYMSCHVRLGVLSGDLVLPVTFRTLPLSNCLALDCIQTTPVSQV